MTPDMIVWLIALSGSMFLALRALRARQLPSQKIVTMGLAWAAIIAIVAILAGKLAG